MPAASHRVRIGYHRLSVAHYAVLWHGDLQPENKNTMLNVSQAQCDIDYWKYSMIKLFMIITDKNWKQAKILKLLSWDQNALSLNP